MLQIILIFCSAYAGSLQRNEMYGYRVPLEKKVAQNCYSDRYVRAWVYFTDKGVLVEDYNEVLQTVTEHMDKTAYERRLRRGGVIDYADIPLERDYIDEVEAWGGSLIRESKWLNAASFWIAQEDLDNIANLDFVHKITRVALYENPDDFESVLLDTALFGLTYKQLNMFNIDELHNQGFFGSDVKIGILDTGFRRVHPALDKVLIVAEHDFLGGDQIYCGDTPVTEQFGIYSDIVFWKTDSRLNLFAPGDAFNIRLVREIMYTYSTDGGSYWQPIKQITNTNNWARELTVCGRDTMFICYRDRSGLKYLVYTDTTIDSGILESDLAFNYREPSAVQFNDTVYVTFHDKNHLYLQKGNISGFMPKFIIDSSSAAIKSPDALGSDAEIGVFYHTYPSLAVYLQESFEDSFPPFGWQKIVLSGSADWQKVSEGSNPSNVAHSGQYQIMFNSFTSAANDSARLITSTINIPSGATSAALEFWMYHDNDAASAHDSLIVEISIDDDTSLTRLQAYSRYQPISHWKINGIDLAPFSGHSIKISFMGKSGHGRNIYLDDIQVVDKFPNNSIYFTKSSIPVTTFATTFVTYGKNPKAISYGDTIFLIWKDISNSPLLKIGFCKSDDFGNSFSQPLYLSEELNSIGKISLAKSNGTVAVIWETGGKVYFRRSIDNGNTFNLADSLDRKFVYLPTLGTNDSEILTFYCTRGDSSTDGYTTNDPEYNHPRHGTEMIGLIGGYLTDYYVGVAPAAQFLVAKTENRDTLYEFLIEEDTYISGLEWCESRGADIVSSSLGYSRWYSWPDQFDGLTSPASIAATEATKRGMVVVTAAGNVSVPRIVVPGDAEGVITVGGIDTLFNRWQSSGYFPTEDHSVKKPEIVCLSAAPIVVDPDSNSYLYSFGTSGATAMTAGICALLLDGHPQWNVDSIRSALFETASHADSPSDSMGYGWPDALAAFRYSSSPYDTTPGPKFLTPYPNPFIPTEHSSITIPFQLDESYTVELRVYSLAGRLIKTESRGVLLPGRYTGDRAFIWDGTDEDNEDVASGLYYCLLITRGGKNAVTKIAVVR